jgi:ribose transport system ATP-binding protein
MTALLEAREVAKSYGSVVALRGVDLTVEAGEIHALLGANGAGKSTLVKILSGVFPADSGSISVNGQPVTMRRPPDALSAGLATVFQDPALVPDLTVAQNLTLTGIDEESVKDRLWSMGMSDFDFGSQIRDLPLEVLRLVDLARALAHDPQLLLLDEITAALPADQAEHVFAIMREWKEKGRSVLFITHRLAEVMSLCDQATILRDGRTVARVDPEVVGEHGLVTPMLGEVAKVIENPTSRSLPVDAPVTLAVRDIHSGNKVNGISFELRAGEILGLAALEGQGQDRLFELLSGDRRPDRGEVVVSGIPMRARSPHDAIERGVVLVPSDRVLALLPKRSVRENLAMPLYNRVKQWLGLVDDETDRTNRAIERLSIDIRAQRQVRRLSGGNQQKVVIGRWLANGFRTLLCFDPTRGIDIHTKRQIYDLLKEVADAGASVLVYTSELPEIPLVCDRVLVLYNGRIVHEQDATSATEEVLLSAAHGLEESA